MNADILFRIAAIGVLVTVIAQVLTRAVGISIIAELGVQICQDAEQSALAGRIRLAARLTMLAMALPLAREIAESLSLLWQ